MATPTEYLLKGVMPELNRLSKKELQKECSMWRNIWSWIPSEVRYYVARTGTMLALTGRNYKRHMGVLLSTRWEIIDLELGVHEKVYDTNTGNYFWEKKIIKTKLGGLIDIQWITERITDEEFMAQVEAEEVKEQLEQEPRSVDIAMDRIKEHEKHEAKEEKQ